MWLFRWFTAALTRQAQPLLPLLGVMIAVGLFAVWTWPLVPIVTQFAGMIAIAFVIRRAREARSQRW